jgi:hypothetical protein
MVVGIGSGTANDGRKAHELVSGLIEMEMGWGEDKQVEVAELSRGVSVEWMEAEQRCVPEAWRPRADPQDLKAFPWSCLRRGGRR